MSRSVDFLDLKGHRAAFRFEAFHQSYTQVSPLMKAYYDEAIGLRESEYEMESVGRLDLLHGRSVKSAFSGG